MKKLFYSLLLLFFSIFTLIPVDAQTQEHNWLVFYSYGIQENDARGFHQPTSLVKPQIENYPLVIRHGVTLSRKILQHKKLNFYAGLGYARELNQLPRYYDHCFDQAYSVCAHVLRSIEDYAIDLAQIPLQSKFFISKGLSLNADIIPEFSIRKVANKNSQNVRRTQIQFYSLSINPGLSYEHRRFFLGLSYRAFQLKTIDEVIFNSGKFFRENLENKQTETFNPKQMTLMMGLKI